MPDDSRFVTWFRVEGRPWPARVLRYVIAVVAVGVLFGALRDSVIAEAEFGAFSLVWLPFMVERFLRRTRGSDGDTG